MRAPLSVVLLVKNEQDRLPDALKSVGFADEIVVADTGSTDETARVAQIGGARVESIGWEGFVGSRNRALAEARHDWVLVLDADERVPPALRDEILAALETERLRDLRLPDAAPFPFHRTGRYATAPGTRITSCASDAGRGASGPKAAECTR